MVSKKILDENDIKQACIEYLEKRGFKPKKVLTVIEGSFQGSFDPRENNSPTVRVEVECDEANVDI